MGSNVNLIPKSITTTNHISYLTVTVAALVLVSRFTGSVTRGGLVDAMERKNS